MIKVKKSEIFYQLLNRNPKLYGVISGTLSYMFFPLRWSSEKSSTPPLSVVSG